MKPLDTLLSEIAAAARFVSAREDELSRLYADQRARYARARALGAKVPAIATAAGVSDAAVHHGIRKHQESARVS